MSEGKSGHFLHSSKRGQKVVFPFNCVHRQTTWREQIGNCHCLLVVGRSGFSSWLGASFTQTGDSKHELQYVGRFDIGSARLGASLWSRGQRHF